MAAEHKSVPPSDEQKDAPASAVEDTHQIGANKEARFTTVADDSILKPVDQPADPEEQIEALGIPNWRELEKKVVRRLDMTLMPCLWVLYLFNYLDRASIAYVASFQIHEMFMRFWLTWNPTGKLA